MFITSGGNSTVSKQKAEKAKPELTLKRKMWLSALSGFLISFTVCIYGVLDIYLNNSSQFSFYLGDFLGSLFFFGILFFAFITLFISIFKGRTFYVVLALFFWLAVMLYIQGNFLNFGLKSLAGDGVEEKTNAIYVIINVFLWIFSGASIVLFAMLFKNKKLLCNVFAVIMVTIIGMQLTSCAVQLVPKAISDTKKSAMHDETSTSEHDETSIPPTTRTEPNETTNAEEKNQASKESTILTTKGLFEVSKKQNIVIFIFDRFDDIYYNELIADAPDFLKPLDGFTYYSDYTSLYSRTYPAAASMITGVCNDFSGTAESYFNKAYNESSFLSDLRQNNYKIKLYTISYYAYRENTMLSEIADNEYRTCEYNVKNESLLTLKMIGLSAYRYLPSALKDTINASSASFSEFIEYSGDFPKYEKSDALLYQSLLDMGLTFQSDDANNYIFIHLQGCHPPYSIDEDGDIPLDNSEEKENRLSALKGCFKTAYEYIDNLKALGIYDESTIIITGDHSFSQNIRKDVFNPRLTSMFVKYRGETGTELRYSDVPVSQDSLIATIIESEGIVTENDYGKSFREINADDIIERRYFFQKTSFPPGNDEIIEYKITGSGHDFDNWEIVNRTNIGQVYK